MKSFLRFFAERRLFANVLTFMIIVLGVGALSIIQRDNFPSVDFDEMLVTTHYPGASPEDVELNVTNKIEEQLKEVDGLERVNSFSMENISTIHIKIDADSKDKKKVKSDVRDAISRVSDLPIEVKEDPLVMEITTATAIPIIEVGLTGDVPYRELREIARQVEKELKRLPGIASLTKYGYLDREIKVQIEKGALEKYRVSPQDIVNAIKNRNIRATGGSFESYTSEKNIITLAQFSDPAEVGNVIIRSRKDDALLRVGDLAVVTDEFEPEKVQSRMNGKPAISFLVFKKESADMIRTVDAIQAFVAENRHRLPKNISIEYSNDKSRIVRNRLSVVASNGLIGLTLVLIVLALFLNLRTAFWVAMGIPAALLGTLFFLPISGVYLDSIALSAMILVIGIIVDDGIVIGESIWHQRELGLSPIDAAVEGTAAMFKPVLTTIITTILAFAPMFFMSGTMGSFVFVIPLVVVLALVISFSEIMLALPAHLVSGDDIKGASMQRERNIFEPLKVHFERLIARVLALRYLVISGAIALLVGAFWYAGQRMDFVLFPTQAADEVYLTLELPSGSSLEHTSEKMKEVEQIISALSENELDSFVTRIGSHGDFSVGENENWASFGIYLTPYSTRNRNADEIVESLRNQITKLNGILTSTFYIDGGGPPVGRPITLRVVGSDDIKRNELAALMVERLQQIAGVKDINRDDKRGKEQIRIEMDYMRLADVGLSVADIAKTVRLAYDGEIVTSVRYGDEDVDFRVILEKDARGSLDVLAELVIPNPDGRFIQLQEVASFRTEPGPSNFYHFDNERAITITADIVKALTTPLKATEKALEALDLDRDWPGMRIITGGEAEEGQKSMESLGVAFVTALIGIYVVLLLLFNSLLQPLLVMLAIPFGLIGVITAFILHGQAMGFLAMLGVIGLIGIVVNDSLILVNLVNELKDKKPDATLAERIIEAATTRLRPILLTSITTVAGLLPMAYGIGGFDPYVAPMALAMGYGILFATPLTLLLLPSLLMVQHDIQHGCRSIMKLKD